MGHSTCGISLNVEDALEAVWAILNPSLSTAKNVNAAASAALTAEAEIEAETAGKAALYSTAGEKDMIGEDQIIKDQLYRQALFIARQEYHPVCH